jgi:hypothetical protein
MHYAIGAIPEGTELEGMAVARMQFPKGMDAGKLLEGLPDNLCPCPHWGYVLKGRMVLTYKDGSEEEVKAGDVYYLPAGHTAVIEEDYEALEFSPADEFRPVMEHVAKKMQEL